MATLAIAIGVTVLAGWQLGLAILKSVRPDWVAMTANAAIGVILCGAALLLLGNPRALQRRLVRLIALVVVVLAALILSQDLFSWNLGLDQLLFRNAPDSVGTLHPGRLAPNTAVCFMAVGACFLLLTSPRGHRTGVLLAVQCLAAFVAGVASLALINFAVELPMEFRWKGITPMAAPTAIAFLSLALGLFTTALRETGAWLIDRRVTLAFAASLALTLMVSGLSSKATIVMERTSGQLERTAAIRFQNNRVLEALERLETGQRGYLLTGQLGFLEPYVVARGAIPAELAGLRELTAASPGQRQRVQTLGSLVEARLEFAGLTLESYRQGGSAAALERIKSGRGEALMKAIRSQVAEIDRQENALSAQHRATADRVAATVFALLPGGGLLSLVILTAGLLLMNREVAERARAESERDRFFTLSVDMMCIADPDGYFKRLSPAFTRTLGWSTDEMLARPYMEFVHPDDREATRVEVERQLVSGESILQFENRYLHKDGSWRVLSWKSAPEADGRMYAAARDVTQSKQAEQRIVSLNSDLLARQEALESLNRELESFSYSISHDLRAPLRHIDGYARMLSEDAADRLAPESQRFLQTIIDSARRMGLLIDELLAFSRLGRQAVTVQAIDMRELVERAVVEAQAISDNRAHIEIVDLPAAAGDPALLRQVWTNLISNAIKYSAPRGEAASVVIGGEQRGERTHYFVRDNGVGFDMRYASKLFGVFQRLHSQAEFEGTGVGLAIVQRIVHRHGGDVAATSEPDRGACFTFDLPTSEASA